MFYSIRFCSKNIEIDIAYYISYGFFINNRHETKNASKESLKATRKGNFNSYTCIM